MYSERFIEELRLGLTGQLGAWGLSPRTVVTLVTVSENATFLARDPERARPLVLRVHRPGYHTVAEIGSELEWIDALRAEAVVTAPEPIAMRGGGRIARFEAPDGATRHVVAFKFLPGREPQVGEDLAPAFRTLGAISARLHRHARGWRHPPSFSRKRWTFETTVGAAPHWGDWRAAIGLTHQGEALLERTARALGHRLHVYGTDEARFGLIHADLRLANLLVDAEGKIAVIDFDDCGFGWFMYDFAAAVSFFEDDPSVPALMEAWIAGYETVTPLARSDAAILPTLVMLRRLLLTAWIASHPETPTAQALGARYTAGTLTLADAFLTRGAQSVV